MLIILQSPHINNPFSLMNFYRSGKIVDLSNTHDYTTISMFDGSGIKVKDEKTLLSI